MQVVNVTKAYLPDKEKYLRYIDKIYAAGWLTNNGHFVQELTKKLENFLGVKNLILVTNATIGLQIAYKALGLVGNVITTPFSFVATTSSLAWESLQPKFVDIRADTFCMNESLIATAINENTSAILPVHVYGNACDVEKIDAIAKKHNLKVVYDAAHAFGVQYKGQSILNYGDIAVLSFHATKLFHTIEGGALIIKDDFIYEKIKKLINFGLNGQIDIVEMGINAKMSEFHAAMGLCVLDDMAFIFKERQRIDIYYRENLPNSLLILDYNESATKNYAYFPVVFESEEQLLKVVGALKESNIVPRRYFYPSLNTLAYVEKIKMPVSESVAKRVLCLPIYPELTADKQFIICNVIARTLAGFV